MREILTNIVYGIWYMFLMTLGFGVAGIILVGVVKCLKAMFFGLGWDS